MPAPIPLTATEAPKLDWSRPGTPAATDFDDIYFSVDGGLAETEAVYLAGCGLPERWQGRQSFTIGELGFGSGLNFLATLRMWEQHKPKGGHLHFISVEKFPFAKRDLERALSAWPELQNYVADMVAHWPGRVKGVHRLHIGPDVTLTLIHDDVVTGLRNLRGQVDAWFLDGFSPAKNPDMWSDIVMSELARLSAPGATVGTFTVAGVVRQALSRAGFNVEKKEGFGRKRHRLEAVFPGSRKARHVTIKPIIIGAGIAGSSLARSFLRRGIVPTLIDPDDGTAASHNPAAIVKPRLDLQDRPESRFFLESYLYALHAYHESGVILSRGVFHAATSESERRRSQKLTEQAPLPVEHMCGADGEFELSGLNFPQGLVIDPIATCYAFSHGAKRLKSRAASIEPVDTGVVVKDCSGRTLTHGTHLCVTAGADIPTIKGTSHLPLRFSRGQISRTKTRLNGALTYGGYAIPLDDDVLLGATHARLGDENPYRPRYEDDVENLEKFQAITGQKATLIEGASRASVRVTRANTLPLCHIDNNIYTLTALGSRGFVFAPWLAETIVSSVCNEVHACLPPSLLVV